MNPQATLTKVSYNPFSSAPLLIPIPTTESQREIWATLQLDPDSSLCYNEALEVILKGQLDRAILERAFQEVLSRHDALRSYFSEDGKNFFVRSQVDQSMDFLDLAQDAFKQEKLSQVRKSQVDQKFDLHSGPCIRSALVKLAHDDHVLFLSAHHLICDGWSFAVIINELSVVYSSLLEGRSSRLPEAGQFVEEALAQLGKGTNRKHLQFWVNQFSPLPKKVPFPIDFERPAFRTYDSRYVKQEVPEQMVIGLKRLAATRKCSFYTVLYATFGILMNRLTGSEKVVIGMASAAQSALGQHDLVGHLVNLLPLPVQVPVSSRFDEYLSSIKTRMLNAFDHQDITFGSILKELNVPRDPANIPLLNTVFNIDQQSPGQGLEFKGLTGSYSTVPRVKENFELFFNATSCENKLTIECQFNSNLFRESTVQNWITNYVLLLWQVLERPSAEIGSLALKDLYVPRPSSTIVERAVENLERDPKIEEAIKGAWSKVLGKGEIESGDNFFVLGGHSLLAVEVASLLKEKLGREVSIKDIFECPTVGGLASRLTVSEAKKVSQEPIKLTGLTSAKLSHNQTQVWYIEELFPETRVHNLPTSLRIKFKVDPRIMEESLHYLIRRHGSLRTRIVTREGVPFQEVLAPEVATAKFDFETVEITEGTLMGAMREEAHKLFDKQSAPLFRVRLYKIGEEDYSLFIMAHHSIWDGWCFDIFFEELDIVYTALLKNQAPKFRRDPVASYIDYTLWFDENVHEGTQLPQLEYWKNKFKAPLPVLELPTDHKRPLMVGHAGGISRFTLTPEQMHGLKEYARSKNSSIFNVMLTAFKITLARYSGQEDIIVGSPVRARNCPEIMQTIGYFVNTVGLRTSVNLRASFEENLKNVTNTCLEAFSNQDVPFETVLNNIEYPKDTSRTAIFQSFFTFQDMTNRHFMLDGKNITQVSVTNASVKTDLDIWVRVTNTEIRGAFEYRSDLFDEETIQRFNQNFFHLIEGLSQNQGKELALLEALHPQQRELVINKWNDTFVDPRNLRPFHRAFEEMVSLHPEKFALMSENSRLTYRELNHLANACARGLCKRGVLPGDLVGISLTRGTSLLVAVLGTLKAGAGYVPLDPGFPQGRLDYMVENSGPAVLISEASLVGRFSAPANKILIEDIMKEGPTDEEVNIEVPLSSTMYVIYTSGSTGNPKGVEISHLAVANFLNSMKRAPGIQFNDKLLAVTTFSFDIAALELYLPLITGATVYMASSYDVIDGGSLRKIIEGQNITMMQATPSTWRLLLTAGWTGNKNFKVLCGGEAFPKDLADSLLNVTGEVWNMYGPTETTIWSSCKRLELKDEMVSIGRPIDNTTIYVLDEGLRQVPIGAAGELYIGGMGLAKGYYGRSDLTLEKFLPDPFRQGEKIYATGDFARFLVNGEVECLGRRDGQVKVRGYRIELGEIELALARTNNFREVAAITMDVRPGDRRIVAFLVSKDSGQKPGERELREALGKSLPQYMVPSHFIYLEGLPKTLNGKIDKKVLPSRFKQEEIPVEVKVPERPRYGGLKGIWQEVLKKESISDQDNFFNIGGNSLLAVQLFSAISKKYGISLTLATLIEHPDFAGFEAHIKSRLSSTPNLPSALSSLVAIRASGNKDPIFCFHGVGGNVLNYIPLANSVEHDRPFLALQCRGLDGSVPLLGSIEEMARSYITEMKIVRPKGPYILAGGSMGGMIAFEVAQQLHAAGEKVEKLIMFDTFGPDINIRSYDKSERNYFKNLKVSLHYRRRALVNKFVVKLLGLLHLPVPLEVRLFDAEMNNYRALWKYRPKKYAGDIHLIRARQRSVGWYSDPYMGWGNTIEGKVITVEIDGKHGSFIESPGLGRALMEVLLGDRNTV